MTMFFDPFRELDRVASSMLDQRQSPRLMPMDLFRDGDHYVLTADLPGVDPGSVDVDVDGQLLTIRAERSARSEEGVQWLQLTLGKDIDTENISAHYENGVLSVMIPVAEKAKPRKIEIATAGDRKKVSS